MRRIALCLAAMGLLFFAADQALAQRIVSRSPTSRTITGNRISGSTAQSFRPNGSFSINGRSMPGYTGYRTPTWRRPSGTVPNNGSSSVVRQPSLNDRIQDYLPPDVNQFLGPSTLSIFRF
jgi:hypothetical protein